MQNKVLLPRSGAAPGLTRVAKTICWLIQRSKKTKTTLLLLAKFVLFIYFFLPETTIKYSYYTHTSLPAARGERGKTRKHLSIFWFIKSFL